MRSPSVVPRNSSVPERNPILPRPGLSKIAFKNFCIFTIPTLASKNRQLFTKVSLFLTDLKISGYFSQFRLCTSCRFGNQQVWQPTGLATNVENSEGRG